MKYAKIIRFDKSDLNIFPLIAEEGELAIVGTFSFFNLNEENLKGKMKQAFSNGFLGIPSFGYSTFITLTEVKEEDLKKLKSCLSDCFLKKYGAPSLEHAKKAADEEVNLMLDLCSSHDKGSLISISREMSKEGIKENFRHLPKAESCAEQNIWTFEEENK
tara:strand:- start:338 stop:820 length:483 start_codon:yes stop_codon:yes gene_type:complete